MIKRCIMTLALLAALAASANAQDYPSRVIKVLQGFAPGGNVDVIARILALQMEQSLGQPIVIEAKPGGGGSLAAELVSRSDPDGYSLLVTPSAHPMYGGLARNVRYKVVDDFTWISTASFYPFLICVRQDSPLPDAATTDRRGAGKSPGDLKYGSSGFGTWVLRTTIQLPRASHPRPSICTCPIAAKAQATTALLTGEIDFIGVTTGPISARIKCGRVSGVGGDQQDALAGPGPTCRRCRRPRCRASNSFPGPVSRDLQTYPGPSSLGSMPRFARRSRTRR